MTFHRRLFLAILLPVFLGMVIACGGGGQEPGKKAAKVTLDQGGDTLAKIPSESEEELDEAIILEATKARDEAIARREQIRAKNDSRMRQYEEEIEAFQNAQTKYDEDLTTFKKANREYKSLRALDFAKNLKTEAGLAKWYDDLVGDFPGTHACKEAQRRLAGNAPKQLAVPPAPEAPTQKPVAPKQPEYQRDPPIPEVPTLAALSQRRQTEAAAKAANVAESATGQGDQKSNPVVSSPGPGKVWVNGYRRKNGTYVSGYWRSR